MGKIPAWELKNIFGNTFVSDIHYMHPSLLGSNGAAGLAFQSYLNQDPKLVEYSDPIFRKVMAELKMEEPETKIIQFPVCLIIH